MAEIKNSFIQGKMNKDLDERLLPNGQYRDALNIEVSTSESSNVGVAKNILGNKRVEELVGDGFVCVGTVADEKTNKLYWFISKYNVDAILEYDIENDIASPVLVDAKAGTIDAVLKFSGNIITGINIVDDLLFFTDNNSEPKKINITECKKGTASDAMEPGEEKHTQLQFENGSFDGITLSLVTPWSGDSAAHKVDYTPGYNKSGRRVWLEKKQIEALLGVDDLITDDASGNKIPYKIRHYRNGEFLALRTVFISDGANGTVIYLSDLGSPYTEEQKIWRLGDVIYGDNISLDIEERHITVIKPKPVAKLAVKVNHNNASRNASSQVDQTSTGNMGDYSREETDNQPNLFETKLPRFSYRYKYRDGEFSVFAPFTEPVFNPKYIKHKNTDANTDKTINADNAYDIKEPYNKAMVNSIHSVELSNFVNAKTPEDVIEIDILYKEENSPVIYSIDTIKHNDKEWHSLSNKEGFGLFLDIGRADTDSRGYPAEGGYTKGKYIVTNENIYAALPENQLLRPWDNVPKKALAQEITGNRIVYGNYVQNYDITSDVNIAVSYENRKNKVGSFDVQPLPSVKSQRNYQLGVAYCDKYGRETPVFTSKNAAVNIPWQDKDGMNNASKSTQLSGSVANNFPEWVDSLKFFVKENSSEYYNLAMQRAWITKSTYDLDNSEGHMYISFPSSDRNKITEDDYIVLKKKIGPGEKQVAFENKYRVIDIKNEAPEAIKYELVNMGSLANDSTDKLADTDNDPDTSLLFNINRRIDVVDQQSVKISVNRWTANNFALPYNIGTPTRLYDDLYISWRVDSSGNNAQSQRYKVIGGNITSNVITLKLKNPITKIDADIAHVNNNATTSGASGKGLNQDLIFTIERKILKDDEDFSGQFFVKIAKDSTTDLIQNGEKVNILDQFAVKAKNNVFYWKDAKYTGSAASSLSSTASAYGLTNYTGDTTNHGTGATSSNNIFSSFNNTVGNTDAAGATHLVTDWHDAWAGIQTELAAHNLKKSVFFVDSMFMAAGQSDASNYAKYCCVTWAGSGKGEIHRQPAWSYPPLKTWITDYEDVSNLTDPDSAEDFVNSNTISNNIWYNNNMISTSPLLGESKLYGNLKVDGWVGPLQNVSRYQHTPGTANNPNNHVNGLEGIITTTALHATGPRRWFSGIQKDATNNGVGVDTETYSSDSEIGRHFMHLSFFAPGKDLHNGQFGNPSFKIFGKDAIGNRLQAIWGGGVFTSNDPDKKFGTADTHTHLPMEGNYDSSSIAVPVTPGPGVGFGYDNGVSTSGSTKDISYQELHERQWDPTFCEDGDDDHAIRDFIRNIHAGARFRFHQRPLDATLGATRRQIDDTVYTIKSVSIKKIYNHTSWRKAFNTYVDDTDGYYNTSPLPYVYKSVEETALEWLDYIKADGTTSGGTASSNASDAMKSKIEQFGKAHNRRLCYIVELDKSPRNSSSAVGNPLGFADGMSGDIANKNFNDIEFLDPVQDIVLKDLNKFPAIWELSPKKQDVDLDIYYEASENIPVKINKRTNELFAPLGCIVEPLNSLISSTKVDQKSRKAKVVSWSDTTVSLAPGLPKYSDTGVEIDYSNMSIKFIRNDGSYTIAQVGVHTLDGVITDFVTELTFREDVGDAIATGLAWYNCFSFGNGLESNRIKDDFNEMFISNGVKASTITQETYKEERRAHGLIYSGIYNSNSGVNNLNQFIMAEKITKDLNPTYGSIQKLFQRRISLIAFCEDRVISIVSNKDAIFNADGQSQLISSNKVLGDANPFQGNYGISKNPESFASESYRAYFTDKQRGAVIRLSKDGLTPISKAGMHDWFRDNLEKYITIIGTYDNYKEDYNLSMFNSPDFSENLIVDSEVETGQRLEGGQEFTGGNIITNPGISSGQSLQYLYDKYNVLGLGVSNPFAWVPPSTAATARIIHHAAIPIGSISQNPADPIVTTIDVAEIAFANAEYSTSLANTVGFPNWIYDPRFANVNDDLFGPSATNLADGQVSSNIKRFIGLGSGNGGFSITESDTNGINGGPVTTKMHPSYHYNSGNFHSTNQFNSSGSPWKHPTSYNPGAHPDYQPGVEKLIYYSNSVTEHGASCFVTRVKNPGIHKGKIVFDRAFNNSYVEFKNIGSVTPSDSGINQTYLNNIVTGTGNDSVLQSGSVEHNSFFNGDEIHIQFTVTCFATPKYLAASGSANAKSRAYGHNHIAPKLELINGSTGNVLDPDKLIQMVGSTVIQGSGTAEYNQWVSEPSDLGPDFKPWGISHFPVSYVPDGTAAYTQIKRGFTGDSSVQFSHTDHSSITDRLGTGSASNPTGGTFTITYGASFKFKDPNQQTSTGTWDGGSTPSPYGITDVKVVDDLIIRISQTALPGDESFYNQTIYNGNTGSNTGDYPYTRPLWYLDNVIIKKGYGVTKPHVPYRAEVTSSTGTGVAAGATNNVPSFAVPAWTEVIHSGYGSLNYGLSPTTTSDTSILSGIDNGNWSAGTGWGTLSIHSSHEYTSEFGGQYDAFLYSEVDHLGVSHSFVLPADLAAPSFGGSGANNPTGLPGLGFMQANLISLYNWPDQSSDFASPFGSSGGSQGANFDRKTQSHQDYLDLLAGFDPNEYYTRDFLDITLQDSSAFNYEFDISDDPFIVNTWYLIDVEFDDSVSDIGSAYGFSMRVMGAAPTVATINGATTNGQNIADSGGYGTYVRYIHSVTGNPVGHIRLQRAQRTEYGGSFGAGDNRTVLRTIFKLHPSADKLNLSAAASFGGVDKLYLRIYNNSGTTKNVKIGNVVAKKLTDNGTIWTNWLSTNGLASNWNYIEPTNNDSTPLHAFDNKYSYLYNNKICWDIPVSKATTSSNSYPWHQDFNTATTSIAPNRSNVEWTLKFNLHENPKALGSVGLSGKLKGHIAIDNPDDPGNDYTGIKFVIDTSDVNGGTGTYRMKFNFGGFENSVYMPASADSIEYSEFGGTFAAYNAEDFDILSTASSPGNYNTIVDKIRFRIDTGGTVSDDQICAISNVSLIDSTSVFTGGSAGAWDFSGFNILVDPHISWDESAKNIQFIDCPPNDPVNTTTDTFINVNQLLTATINKFEQYKISFTHNLTGDATIDVYYYNSDGYGFKIKDIANQVNNTALGTGDMQFEQNITIGDSQWSNINEANANFAANLKNTFVIEVQGAPTARVSGYIDNIKMQRVYDFVDLEDTTVSFSETVNGWTSFKSFVPENGLSVSKKYFTLKEGGLYKHYTPMFDSDDILNADEANNYNNFYGEPYESTITAVLNQEPSLVKLFHTLSYEGTQSRILKPKEVVGSNSIDDQMTLNNSIAYKMGNDLAGWYCAEIKTDLNVGTVKEFIKKEGKWFNYIKGASNLKNGSLNTGLFSVFGGGMIDSVKTIYPIPPGGTTAGIATAGASPVVTPTATPTATPTVTPTVTPTTPPPTTGGGGGTTGGGY